MTKNTDKNQLSSNEVWGQIIQLLWHESDLVDGIYEMMKHQIKAEHYNLIDVSGGTGFPLIGLRSF